MRPLPKPCAEHNAIGPRWVYSVGLMGAIRQKFWCFLRVWDSREKEDTRKRNLVTVECHAFRLRQIELSPEKEQFALLISPSVKGEKLWLTQMSHPIPAPLE